MPESLAAIQVKGWESPHAAIHVLMQTCSDLGLKFKRLEVLGTTQVGARDFVRFRVDREGDWLRVVKNIQADRAIVVPNGAGFRLYLPGGREGRVAATTMLTAPTLNQPQVYRGPAVKLWERQFLDGEDA